MLSLILRSSGGGPAPQLLCYHSWVSLPSSLFLPSNRTGEKLLAHWQVASGHRRALVTLYCSAMSSLHLPKRYILPLHGLMAMVCTLMTWWEDHVQPPLWIHCVYGFVNSCKHLVAFTLVAVMRVQICMVSLRRRQPRYDCTQQQATMWSSVNLDEFDSL